MLADPDIQVIETFDLLNEAGLSKDDDFYGFAYAGYFLMDENGVVTSKYFNEKNNERATSASILIREFGSQADGRQGEVETQHLTLRWSATNTSLRPGQRGALVLDVELKPEMHVYAPAVEGYIPVDWQISPGVGVETSEAEYPTAERMYLPAIQETVPVYTHEFRVVRDVHLLGSRELPPELEGQDEVVIEGSFRYQACDDEKCFFPLSIPLKWTLQLEPHDRVRVPEEMRRSRN